jgi:hypothetical protein
MSDEDDDNDAPASRTIKSARPSLLDKAAQLRVFKNEFREDANHSSNWRTTAKEEFGFVAGDQWTPDEKSQLKDQLRPEIVFNRSITLIKAVAGFEINGRHEIQFLPRTLDDAAINDVLTGASKWMADECDGEDEESESFQDTLICGMGWCENRMDWEMNSQGMYVEDQVSPLEMYWDRNARKKNLTDARRFERLKKMTLADAMALFPDAEPEDLDAAWAVGDSPDEATKSIEQKRIRDENTEPSESDEVHILERQWWERVPMWLVADEATNKKIEMTEEEYATLCRRMKLLGLGKLTAVKIHKRKFYRAFIGAKVLECGDGPLPDRFSYACITGQLDKVKGIWFGLIRIMRDPQKWANKWLSQTLHIMNSQAKGGIMAEADAFEDQRQAEETWSKPEAITWMKKGALGDPATNKGPKWALKPTAEFPAGFYQLLEFAISSLRDIPGINLELLGQKDINQPGVLEAQRKQAGMTVLATMFDSLRRFRKLTGRIRLYYIQTFLSDGRLIRITGPEGAKVIPLLRDKTLGEFDVVVDDTPTSPNQKQANWAVIAPMIPMFKDQLVSNPPLLIELMRYSPLPDRLVSAFETLINKPPDPEAEQAKKLAIAAKVAAINKDQSIAEMNDAKAQTSQATAAYDIAMARNLLMKNDTEGLKAHLDNMHKAAQIQTERAKVGQIAADTANTHADTHATHADAAHTAVKMLIDAATPIPDKTQAQAA